MNNRDLIQRLLGNQIVEYLKEQRVLLATVDAIYECNIPKSLRGGSGNTRYLNQDRIKTILNRVIQKDPITWVNLETVNDNVLAAIMMIASQYAAKEMTKIAQEVKKLTENY